MVMCLLWDLKVQLHLLKLLGEFDRAALPLQSCLQFIVNVMQNWLGIKFLSLFMLYKRKVADLRQSLKLPPFQKSNFYLHELPTCTLFFITPKYHKNLITNALEKNYE